MNFIDSFKIEMFKAGIEIDAPINADGRLHRVHVVGDRKGTLNCWYILFPDFPAVGCFGCWKRNVYRKWQGCNERNLALADLRLLHERKQQAQAKLNRAFSDREEELRILADIWRNADQATDQHGYLVKKRVRAHGLRYHKGALLVPVMDADGTLHGLQRIWPQGSKRFIKGSIKAGHFYMIGVPQEKTFLICEGYSTGATLHEISGHAVIVAFDSGNLRLVAEAVHSAWPSHHIFVCGDDDHHVPGNPGLNAAAEAAEAVQGTLVIPFFPIGRAAEDTDFNDLFIRFGATTVRESLAKEGVRYV